MLQTVKDTGMSQRSSWGKNTQTKPLALQASPPEPTTKAQQAPQGPNQSNPQGG